MSNPPISELIIHTCTACPPTTHHRLCRLCLLTCRCRCPPQIVREHYLRDDIYCGSAHCSQCDPHFNIATLAAATDLLPDAVAANTLFPFAHYLVLDTNVVLDQIHVLEEPVLRDCIVLQTVAQEVRHRSSLVYKKLLEVCEQPERRFYTFVNEHHK